MCCLEGTPSEGMTLSGGRRRRIPFRPRAGLPAVRARQASAAAGVHAGRAELPARARAGRRADRPGPSRRRGRRRRPARGRARREAGRDPAGPLPRRLLRRGRGQPAAGADDRLWLLRPGRAEADHLVDGGAEPRPHGDGDRRPRGAAERARARPAPAGHAEGRRRVGVGARAPLRDVPRDRHRFARTGLAPRRPSRRGRRGAVVSAPWIAAYAVLWLAVLVVTFTVLGIVRRIGGVLEGMERRLSAAPADFGAAVDSTVAPYVLDPTGRVLDRRVPGSLRHVEEMAREQRRRAENGAGAAAEAQPIGRRA